MPDDVLYSLRSLFIFAAGIFTLLNGPLWVSGRVKVLVGGPQAPAWLYRGISWASRLAGMAILTAWAWDATGALILTFFILDVLAIGLFCWLNGPAWLVTRVGVFNRGCYVPAWLAHNVIWFFRLTGVGALNIGFFVGLRAAIG